MNPSQTIKRTRAVFAAVMVIAVGIVLSGCSSSGDTPTPTDGTPSSGMSSQQQQTSDSDDSSESSEEPTSDSDDPSESSQQQATDDDVVANPPEKSWQDALDAASGEFDGDVSKIELESQEGGGLAYKIELTSSDQKYAVQYDAESLDELSSESDDLGDDADEKQTKTFDPDSIIGLDDASDAARQEQDGAITSWKVEGKSSDVVQYEFDILPEGASDDVEVQIDAHDGSVISD